MSMISGLDTVNEHLMLGTPEHTLLFRLFDSVGNGTGTKDMSTTADAYYLDVPDGYVYVVDSVKVTIVDDAAIDINGWGGLAALTTGCKFEIQRQKTYAVPITVLDLTDGTPFKDHGQLGRLARLSFSSDATGCVVQASFNFREDFAPLRLKFSNDERLVWEVQDDLSGLALMEVSANGRIYQDPDA